MLDGPQIDYFNYCMDTFREQFDSETRKTIFVMVSNENDWLRNSFGALPDVAFPGQIAVIQDNMMPARDMALMGLCDHLIRSYGTYSLWGGFFSGGIVMSAFSGRTRLVEERVVLAFNSTNWILVDILPFIEKHVSPADVLHPPIPNPQN